MPKPFPAEFRRDVIAVARKGEAPIAQIAKVFGISEAAARLGHVDENITKKFYVQKPSTAPDVSHALEILIGAGDRQ